MKNKINNYSFSRAIEEAVESFKLDLSNLKILTEAATGNYVVTSLIAAQAGASVISFSADSKYGSMELATEQTISLARFMGLEDNIEIVKKSSEVDLSDINLVTNTGFVRPINKSLIRKLNSCKAISLMYEPWEFRKEDIDLEYCSKKGIIIFGTDESDSRVRTIEYIGYLVIYLLLMYNQVPIKNHKLLLLGCPEFANTSSKIIKSVGYDVDLVTNYDKDIDVSEYDSIVIMEHKNKMLLISNDKDSYINSQLISSDTKVIHICGNVDFTGAKYFHTPVVPASFGNMSFTTDFVDFRSLVNLQTAGLKVGEGIIESLDMNLKGQHLVDFMTKNYPALPINNDSYYY